MYLRTTFDLWHLIHATFFRYGQVEMTDPSNPLYFFLFAFCPHFLLFYNSPAYSFSSDLRRALGLVTLIDSCWARSMICFLFLLDTSWAISAENVRFCIISTSNSCNERTKRDIFPIFRTTSGKNISMLFNFLLL